MYIYVRVWMCALAWVIVFEHRSGSMMHGADRLSWLGSADTDSRPGEDGEAATTLLVLGL